MNRYLNRAPTYLSKTQPSVTFMLKKKKERNHHMKLIQVCMDAAKICAKFRGHPQLPQFAHT